MERVADYILQERINETRNSIIYRGKKEQQTVIVKVLKTRNPTPAEIARFKQGYELVKNLASEGIVRALELVEENNLFAIVEEDFNGVSIREIIKIKPISLPSFLRLGSRVAEILGNLHKNNIIHMDIKPANILLNKENNMIKITDFGISSVLTHANDELYNPDVVLGTLAYMSPEQTGRMNRGIDYRTDLYSLGVTFYEMLTGVLPFESKDPMELIHAHIARMPRAPHEVDGSIPDVVSEIILKLLAKTPEERYQNSFGVMADIDECLQQLAHKGSIAAFPLMTKDTAIKFNIPQLIVGREKELDTLLETFEKMSSGTAEMMLVLGQPGIGKSALINELHKPVVAGRGYFIYGKYDQFRRDVPYSAVIQAFQLLIRQIITESEERITAWKEKLLAALGSIGKVITGVIPELELIIDKQPEIEELAPEESQNQFNLAFQRFINVFTAEAHPLVLFLDDLQWADLASLKLLKTIITSRMTQYLLFIGAYRDSEVSQHHPLAITLDEIRKSGKKINSLSLGPLDVNNTNIMIKNVLRCKEHESLPLAALIHRKTSGNPFFIIQFLKKVYDEHILKLDPGTVWQWDTKKIEQMQITDNVVEFMAEKISTLPLPAREMLKVCACIGNRFELEMLAVVSGKPIEEVLALLGVAVQEGLVILHGNMYKFRHDRIQEAVYSLIPEEHRVWMHYTIGKNVLAKTGEANLHEKIFYITDQLNKGIALLDDTKERLALARLNHTAGVKARDSTAYASALSYIRAGIGLLPADCWESHYRLTYDLHKELLECEYLTMGYERAEQVFNLIVANAKTGTDKANVYSQMIILKNSTGDYNAALEIGIAGMKMVGYRLPRRVSDLRLGIELLKLRFRFGRMRIEDLLDLPIIKPKDHPEQLAKAYLDTYTGTVAYIIDQNLCYFIATFGMSVLIKRRFNFEYSPMALCGMGSILIACGLYDQGYRFGKTSLALYEKIGGIKNRAKTYYNYPYIILHWKEHAKHGLDYLREAYKSGLQGGDLIYSGYAVNVLAMHRIILGHNLDEIMEEYAPFEDFQMSARDPFTSRNYQENIQMIHCLKGRTVGRGSLNSDSFDEDEQLHFFTTDGNKLGRFYHLMVKLRIRYLFGLHHDCLDILEKILGLLHEKVALGTLHVPEFYFYYSLLLTALWDKRGSGRNTRAGLRLRLNQLKMKKWARYCPDNFLHKYLLVEAEIAKNRGNIKNAVRLYEAAIKSAHENGYTQNEGMANERAALLMTEIKNREDAQKYIRKAYACYAQWGASAKTAQLEINYPELLGYDNRNTLHAGTTSESLILTRLTSSTMGTQALDLSTIIKTSLALSSEINLGKLLKIIIKLALENAGAGKGFMILEKEEEHTLCIEAESNDEKEVEVLKSIPVEKSTNLAKAVVNYVNKTKEPVILNNAHHEGAFTHDPYIIKNKPKSILCTPIIYKGKMAGILYLENNLTTNAFTPSRLELLQILSAQAAISIENAILYERAVTDGLTGIYNRTFFDNYLMKCFYNAIRYKKKLSLLMIDIDDFKKVNDNYGHLTGDLVIRSIARMITDRLRKSDLTARYGGEEFVVVLTETELEGARQVAEQIRRHIEESPVAYMEDECKKQLHVTVSIGISEFNENENRVELIERADRNMYRAKKAGKNTIR